MSRQERKNAWELETPSNRANAQNYLEKRERPKALIGASRWEEDKPLHVEVIGFDDIEEMKTEKSKGEPIAERSEARLDPPSTSPLPTTFIQVKEVGCKCVVM